MSRPTSGSVIQWDLVIGRAASLCVLAACGRLDFEPVHDGAAANVEWVQPIVQLYDTGGGPLRFPLAPIHVGDAVVIATWCGAPTAPTTTSITAPGWTFFQLGNINQSANTPGSEWFAVFGAIVPSTVPTTAMATWGGTTCTGFQVRSEEHTSELQSLRHLVCRLLLEKKK